MDTPDLDTARAQVASVCRRLADEGLVPGTAGNVSARVGDRVVITATGTVLGQTTAEQVVVVDLEGRQLAGDYAPTSELELHLAVYRIEGARAVVHHHATHATTLSTLVSEVPVVHYQQLALGGSLRVAPFEVFGTPALTAGVLAALQDRRGALMANHGALAWGEDLAEATENALLLEWACTLYWKARALGQEPACLSEAQQAAVLAHIRATRYGRLQSR